MANAALEGGEDCVNPDANRQDDDHQSNHVGRVAQLAALVQELTKARPVGDRDHQLPGEQ